MRVNYKKDSNLDEISVDVCYLEKNREVDMLIDYINKFSFSSDTYVVKKDDSYQIIKVSEIYCIEVFKNSISLRTLDEEYEFKGRLYKVLEELNSTDFIQISKSAIININYLVKLEVLFTGMVAVLSNGKKIAISRSYFKGLKTKLGI